MTSERIHHNASHSEENKPRGKFKNFNNQELLLQSASKLLKSFLVMELATKNKTLFVMRQQRRKTRSKLTDGPARCPNVSGLIIQI